MEVVRRPGACPFAETGVDWTGAELVLWEAALAHTDQYEDFAHLNAEQTEGLAFRICATHRGARLAIIAPHGGKIEPHTSEVASSIARDDFDLYCFEGLLPTGNFRILHITLQTSTNPDAWG